MHTHTRAHMCIHTHTRAHTRAHTHARTHTRTHTHTQEGEAGLVHHPEFLKQGHLLVQDAKKGEEESEREFERDGLEWEVEGEGERKKRFAGNLSKLGCG